ncbi:MAG: BatA and WFA domain-containing protein [Planctomycetota bacterium]|nr:BatA and WFA domain-containing protein [Planctomycetota bacterium]MDA1105803.1 BatA and WFA domain-containing protein [Planctomycetota bacterium]
MTWLDPWTGLLVAGGLLPPLIALYILKLRRRTREVPSTLLWRTATADLRANVPFQRLRFSLLLLLQFLVLALLALALSQPEVQGGARAGKHAMLIDRSLSMQAQDGDGGATGAQATRLAEAKRQATDRIASLHSGSFWMGDSASVMVVAFGGSAQVLSGFTDGEQQSSDAVETVEPVDGSSEILEAIELVRSALATVNPDDQEAAAPEEVVLEIFSDGRIDDLSGVALRPEESIIFHSIGDPAAANRGVVSLGMTRDPDEPSLVKTLARLVHWGDVDQEADVELRVDGRPRAVLPVPTRLPARVSVDGVLRPGEVEVAFPAIALPQGGLVEVAFSEPDMLPRDDVAGIIVPPPRELRLALLGADDFVLRSVLESLEPAELVEFSAKEFLERSQQDEAFSRSFDAIIVRGTLPLPLPPGRYLCFGNPEGLPGVEVFGTKEGAVVVGSRSDHALLRYVALDELVVRLHAAVVPTARGEVVIEGSEGPLAIASVAPSLQLVIVPFDPLDSNWPFQRGFLNFSSNAVQWLAGFARPIAAEPRALGQSHRVEAGGAGRTVQATHASGRVRSAMSGADGLAVVGPLDLLGIWSIEVGGVTTSRIAVEGPGEDESRLDVANELQVSSPNGQAVSASGSGGGRRAIWSWLLLAALAMLALEWWWYLRQV